MEWLVFAVLSAFTASLVTIFGKIGLADVDPGVASFVRAGIMFAFLAGFAFFSGKLNFSSINRNALFYIILAGIAGAISWIFYFFALQRGDATRVASIDRLSIVMVLVFSLLFLGEKFDWKVIAGVIAMVVGAILVII